MERSYTLRVRLTAEELAKLNQRRGPVPLSAFVRCILFPTYFELGSPGGSTVEAVIAPADSDEPKKSKGREKTKPVCAHGTEKGYNCWQCGGLAKIWPK
jgi:hypothetical protein